MTTASLERVVRRDFCAPFSVKALDEGARSFRGLASTWQKDLGNDVIHKGAFKKTLAEWSKSKGRPIPLLDGHDRMSVLKVLGKMVDAIETDEGLEAEFEMVPDDADAAAALKRVKGGFVSALSIGYTPVEFSDEKDSSGLLSRTRHLKEIKLHEISLVVFPMNEGARIDASSVKSLLDAAKAGQLTDDEKAELLALLQPAAATPPAPDALPKGLAPEIQRSLQTRIAAIQSRRFAGLSRQLGA
jgi:HK97 family phage prohead protease